MQYHIFEINPFKQVKFLQSCPDYKSARSKVRELRKQAADRSGGSGSTSKSDGFTYRMMFAANPEQAERLMKEKREPRPMGEHD